MGKNSEADTAVVFFHTRNGSELPSVNVERPSSYWEFLGDSLRKFCERFADKAGTLYKAFTGGKNILCGKTLRGKEKKFPQAGYVHSTLTEKIHSLRIAASEGPIRSMVEGHDESTR